MDEKELLKAYKTLKAKWQHVVRTDGFAVAQEVAAALGWGERELSSVVARCEYRYWLKVTDHYRGLSCDGEGLNQDPAYQVVKLRFDE